MEKTIEVCYNELKSADKKEVWIMANNCETCVNYEYDEEYDYYVCAKNLDEDEMYRFLSGSQWECPYYSHDDEYAVVRHQI
jgi:hypothetical protein